MHAVDVLIPTYRPNRTHLEAALKSLQEQKFTDWQAFIHDDAAEGSEAENTVQPFLSDQRIHFEQSHHRLGIGGNWNACIRATSAPLVAFLFQDDVWNPDYLATSVKILNDNPSIGFVSMEHEYRAEGKSETLALYREMQDFIRNNMRPGAHEGTELLRFWIKHELHPNIIGEPSFVVVRRECLERAGLFLEDMPQFVDMEEWLRLLTVCDWYRCADHSYGTFRIHDSAASAVNQQSGIGLYDRLRCFERLIPRLTGADQSAAVQARNRAVEKMITKFFGRVGSGQKASAQGSNLLVQFCLRHPVLIMMGIVRHFLTK